MVIYLVVTTILPMMILLLEWYYYDFYVITTYMDTFTCMSYKCPAIHQMLYPLFDKEKSLNNLIHNNSALMSTYNILLWWLLWKTFDKLVILIQKIMTQTFWSQWAYHTIMCAIGSFQLWTQPNKQFLKFKHSCTYIYMYM